MSLAKIPAILGRITAATKKSPIAIFRTPEKITDRLDAMFAATVTSKIYIEQNQKNLIGIFDQSMLVRNKEKVRNFLQSELNTPSV